MTERSCVGCRRVADKAQLLRFVAVGEALTIDPEARLPGRGAYLHRDERCWEQAVHRNAFRRALRRNLHLPADRPF